MNDCCERPDIELMSEDGFECLNCGRALGHRLPEAPTTRHAPDLRRRGHLVRDGSPLYAAACSGCEWESEGLFTFPSEARAAAKVLHALQVSR